MAGLPPLAPLADALPPMMPLPPLPHPDAPAPFSPLLEETLANGNLALGGDLAEIVGSFLRVDFLRATPQLLSATRVDRITQRQHEDLAPQLAKVDATIRNMHPDYAPIRPWMEAHRTLLAHMGFSDVVPKTYTLLRHTLGTDAALAVTTSLPWDAWAEKGATQKLQNVRKFVIVPDATPVMTVGAWRAYQDDVLARCGGSARDVLIRAAEGRLPHNRTRYETLPPLMMMTGGLRLAAICDALAEKGLTLVQTLDNPRTAQYWKGITAKPNWAFSEDIQFVTKEGLNLFPVASPCAMSLETLYPDLAARRAHVNALPDDDARRTYLRNAFAHTPVLQNVVMHFSHFLDILKANVLPLQLLSDVYAWTGVLLFPLDAMGDIPWHKIDTQLPAILGLAFTFRGPPGLTEVQRRTWTFYITQLYDGLGASFLRLVELAMHGRLPHFALASLNEPPPQHFWTMVGPGSILAHTMTLAHRKGLTLEHTLRSEAGWRAWCTVMRSPQTAIAVVMKHHLTLPVAQPAPPAPQSASSLPLAERPYQTRTLLNGDTIHYFQSGRVERFFEERGKPTRTTYYTLAAALGHGIPPPRGYQAPTPAAAAAAAAASSAPLPSPPDDPISVTPRQDGGSLTVFRDGRVEHRRPVHGNMTTSIYPNMVAAGAAIVQETAAFTNHAMAQIAATSRTMAQIAAPTRQPDGHIYDPLTGLWADPPRPPPVPKSRQRKKPAAAAAASSSSSSSSSLVAPPTPVAPGVAEDFAAMMEDIGAATVLSSSRVAPPVSDEPQSKRTKF